MKASASAIFLTLTYHDSVIPLDQNGIQVLKKTDLQKFIKLLRRKHDSKKYWNGKIRYFAIGEYGTKTGRPHYHLLLFNVDPRLHQDMEMLKLWKKGLCHIGQIQDASIHYVTQFHVNCRRFDDDDPREPEFSTMSKVPAGIGYQYIKKARKWHIENRNLYVINNGYKQRIPRYYADKIFPKWMKEIEQIKAEEKALEQQYKEERRLYKLGYEYPSNEIFERNYQKSLQIKKQALKKGRF